MNKKFLFEMINTPSPTGGEFALQKKIIKYMKDFDIETDYTGNVICSINNDSDFKVLLAGHVDEIAYMISDITSKGLLKVVKAGGVYHKLAQGQRVEVFGKEVVPGVFGVSESDKGVNTDVKPKDLFVDCGFTSKDEALKKVSIGDFIVYENGVTELENNRIVGRALDNRLGAFIVTEALRKLKGKTNIGVYSATTVGEESTMRGAYWANVKVNPTFAIVVDVTFATDYPSTNPATSGFVELDKGPVLAKGSIINDKINDKMAEIAKKHNINIQWELTPGRTGTDGDRIHVSGAGTPLALISIPLRYMHSPGELGSLKDVEDIINLIVAFLSDIDSTFDINPFN